MTSLDLALTAISAAADWTDISPQYDAPWIASLRRILSWVFGTVTLLAFLALLIAVAAIVFRGFGSERVRQFAADNILWVVLAVAALGALNGIFAFALGFDLGF